MSKRKPQSSTLTRLTPEEALICTMVLVAAADGAITDREIGVMSGVVQTLPAFEDFSSEELRSATEAAISLLEETEGLSHAGQMIRDTLEPRLRETAYALACEVVAANKSASQPVLRMLELVVHELKVDPLVAAAVERSARARYQRIAPLEGKQRKGNRPSPSGVDEDESEQDGAGDERERGGQARP